MSRDHRGDVLGDSATTQRLWVANAVDAYDGFVLGECIDSEGETQLWLLSSRDLGRNNVQHGRPDADHERLGRLPAVYRRRLREASALRCGAPRRCGLACLSRVARRGDRCWAHDEDVLPTDAPRPSSLQSSPTPRELEADE